MKRYYEKFKDDLKDFYEMTEKFYKKEITVVQYKGFSGGFGSYAQRGGERSMLRLRLPGGEVSQDNLDFIAGIVQEYNIEMSHITTCQTIQLHNLTQKNVCELIGKVWEHGIITRGGGGDFPRNVMCSPLSGVEKDEYFDVLPYAVEAGNYMLGFIGEVKLPRKLKVCFSNSPKNITHATFRDMGFVAREDGRFDLYVAGGLGNNPKLGVKVVDALKPSKILYCIKTMVDIFTEHGNYENRAKSRTRYLQDTLGVDGLQKIFAEKLEANLQSEDLDIEVKSFEIKKTGEPDKELEAQSRITPQKQNGLYSVSYQPVGGILTKADIIRINDTIAGMEDVKLRLTPAEGMYIINLTADEAKKVLAATADGAATAFERSTACIGASICQQGIGNSQEMLKKCVDRVKQENFADGVLPSVHISGCPSSCSAHQIADIGLRGGMKPSENGPKPAFAVYENGCELQGSERFGDELGVMYADDIPEFFVELGKAVTASGMSYKEYSSKMHDELVSIANRYV